MSGGPDLPDLPDERDARAAEYVLGTLPASERSALEAERAADPATEAAVRDWERRLAPLALAVPDAAPPARVWDAIRRALPGAAGASAANDNRVRLLTRQVRRWRLVSAGTALIAAGLAALVAVGPRPQGAAPGGRYVAVVTSGGDLPALLVSVDTGAGTAQVRPVAAKPPEGRSLELWYVAPGAAPKTLGLVGADAGRVALPAGAAAGEGVFAVSSEPPGGSPTGQPTGQVLYTGKLIRD